MFERMVIYRSEVDRMSMGKRRRALSAMRYEDVTVDTFLPEMGMCVGEFAIFQLLHK